MCNLRTERSPSEIDFYGSHNCSQLICIGAHKKVQTIRGHDLWAKNFLKNIFLFKDTFFSGHRLQTEDNAHEIKHTQDL